MGAMQNDLNRCNFMYADDRRCRNLISSPGNPFCYYHSQPRQERKPRKPASIDHPAARTFFNWLASHPLDNATNLNRALNQLVFLRLRNRISARRADSLLRMLRLLFKTVPDVRDEFRLSYKREHTVNGPKFLDQIDDLLSAAAEQDSQSDPQNQEPPLNHAPEPTAQPTPVQNPHPSQDPAIAAIGRNGAEETLPS